MGYVCLYIAFLILVLVFNHGAHRRPDTEGGEAHRQIVKRR